jgi:xanthine/uracil permease
MPGAMGSEGLSQSSLLYRLTDRLPVRTALLLAAQHVLAMFCGLRVGGFEVARRIGGCAACGARK